MDSRGRVRTSCSQPLYIAAKGWSCHALRAPKARWSGELLGVQWGRGTLGVSMHWRRGRLGAAIHSHLSNHRGLESSAANTQDTARLGVPYTEGAQTTEDWRRGALGAAIHEQRPKLRGSGAGLKLKTLFSRSTSVPGGALCFSGPRYPQFYLCTQLDPPPQTFLR